jgi:shikimate dehydrogenase
VATLVIANRTAAKAHQLAADVARRYPDIEVLGVALDSPVGAFDIVINGTSAGLDNTVVPISDRCIRGAFCYDMVYGARTAFCDWAQDRGAAATRDGLGMLVEQAAVSFYLWRGIMPDAGAVLKQLRKEIERG